MREHELDASRETKEIDVKRINELELWFRHEYPTRLNTINRHAYLGLPLEESRYELEIEAYHKENELRVLKGQKELPELPFKDFI